MNFRLSHQGRTGVEIRVLIMLRSDKFVCMEKSSRKWMGEKDFSPMDKTAGGAS